MKLTTTALAAAMVVCAFLAFSQQPASPGPGAPGGPGRGGRGFGGFSQPDPIDFADHNGWKSMFDGETLNGWDGNPEIWHVENGFIVAESTCEKPVGTTYLIWKGGEPADFELKAELRGEGAGINSGIQYRSFLQPPPQMAQAPGGGGAARGGGFPGRGPAGPCPSGQPRGTPDRAANAKWNLGGPQSDFDGSNRFTGQYYEGGTSRGIVAWRGQVVKAEEGKKPRLLALLGDRDELGGYVKINDWNQLHIIARGNQLIHIINGHVMAVFIDEDPTKFRKSGLIGLQIEGTGKVNFRNLWIKTY
jgi:3-keto-disaccharide hydrolase